MESLLSVNNIVTYHKISPHNNLRAHFNLYQKENTLVTVDDGDISFYQYMFPLLKEHGMRAVLFIITELIDSDTPFWWDEIVYLLGEEEGNRKVWEVKEWPNQERVAYLNKLREESGKPKLEQVQLTTSQLQEMQEAGVVIANHSHTHPMLDTCTEEELRNEFQKSRFFFEERQLQGYEILAYPNGNSSALTERIAKEEGIALAFLFDHQTLSKNYNPYRISRLSVTDQTSISKLRFILSGWHSKILPLRKKVFSVLNNK